MGGHHVFTTVFHFYHAESRKSVARLRILVSGQALHLEKMQKGR
ncbi:hypothetical protein HMPREF0208_04360 [Citrobacter koseri]|nr:hypothetical protein HMPREF3207_04271 [Citrobacter koseri]KXB40488.1 hypothetical protein HMPREF0208_04360 [Citrobacter koseri]